MSGNVQSGFLDAGAARLYFEACGTPDQPVLLCLHGLGGGTHFFRALVTALADRCRTVAIDLPGSGLSPRLDSAFCFDTAAALVVELARSKLTGGRAICLLGHSMGAIIALEAIRRSPDLAEGLIVAGGLPEPPAAARERLRERVAAIRRDGIDSVIDGAVAANFSRRSQAGRPELVAWFAELFARQDPAAYADTAGALASWTARVLPPLDRVPCLAVTGEEDRYAPPDAVRAFARALPDGTRVEIMPDCGHLPFLEQPGAFAAIVSLFLRDRCRWL